MAAGGFAGGVEGFLTYPAELVSTSPISLFNHSSRVQIARYVKTQLQLESKKGPEARFKGPIDCVLKTVREKGVRALYRGVSAMILGNSIKAGVRFVAYEQFRRLFGDSGVGMMGSGLGAGMVEAVLVVTPSETIKWVSILTGFGLDRKLTRVLHGRTKLIHDQNSAQPRFKGLAHATRTIFAEEGLAGIWRGVGPVMARQGANQAVRFSAYGTIKDFLARYYPADEKGVVKTPWYVSFGSGGCAKRVNRVLSPNTSSLVLLLACSGVVAGITTVYTTMPIDVIKTKMQSLDGKKRYGNSLNCVAMVWREEGVKAFWKGSTARLGRLMVSRAEPASCCPRTSLTDSDVFRFQFSGAIVFTVYESITQAVMDAQAAKSEA